LQPLFVIQTTSGRIRQQLIGLAQLLKAQGGLLGGKRCGVGMQSLALTAKGLPQLFLIRPDGHTEPCIVAGGRLRHGGFGGNSI
jgi:hypothetical protein